MANTDAASGGGTVTATTSQSGGWGDFIPLIVNAGSALLGGYASSKGATDQADAERKAAEEAARLSREVYYDHRGLARPGYMTGGAATNALANIFGLPAQDYGAAYGGAYSGGYGAGGSGPSAANNWGAGQPVAGHSGGGGPNALTGAIGAGIGNVFGGPIGGAVGGALGGLVRNGGDNWQTLATGAPQGLAYDEYFNSQPGFATEWAKPDVQSLFNGNRDAYIWWHANGGNINGKQSWAPNTDWLSRQNVNPTTGAVEPAAGTGQSGANALADPMKAFTDSPYGKIATSGFRGVDVPEINGAFARGGKVLSGAQSIALDERGKARLGGAFNDYTNGLRSLAGMNQTASSQIGSAAGQYGVNAGNAIIQAGQAKGNALKSGWDGISQGINGAVGALSDFGRKNWGWA